LKLAVEERRPFARLSHAVFGNESRNLGEIRLGRVRFCNYGKDGPASHTSPKRTTAPRESRSRCHQCGVRHSVQSQYFPSSTACQVTWREYLCVISPIKTLFHILRRVDPAGFEPASATWTECCVAVTPRALHGVCARMRTDGNSSSSDFYGWLPNWEGTYATRIQTAHPSKSEGWGSLQLRNSSTLSFRCEEQR
jgi:hypothetical protein